MQIYCPPFQPDREQTLVLQTVKDVWGRKLRTGLGNGCYAKSVVTSKCEMLSVVNRFSVGPIYR